MLQLMSDSSAFFISFFANPTIWGIGLAIIFGTIWLACYFPPLFHKPWLWAILIASAILTLIAVAFIQLPLQKLSAEVLNQRWDPEILLQWILLAGIPAVVISGLVQEGAKLVPVVVYWWRSGRNIDPKLGLVIGAVAGAGFGIFEAQWLHNMAFAMGWSWDAVQTNGFVALTPFTERFFIVAFHTAASALAGYGLAKGLGWQFYLLVSLLHTIINYIPLLIQAEILSFVQAEICIAVWAILITGSALWIRWKKPVTKE